MSTNSPAVSDSPVDLEKEVGKEEELAIVDPQKAKLCSRLMDALLVVYVLLFAGFAAYVFKHSNNWRDLSLGLLVLLPVMAWNFWLIPKLKRPVIKVHATKRSPGSGNDLSAKLLAAEK